MRGRTLLILGCGVKGQGQRRHSVYKTLGFDTAYSFCPITFKFYMQVLDNERRNLIDLGLGSKVKVNFSILCIKPYGHDTDLSFCPITLKLHMLILGMMKGGTLLILGHRVRVQFWDSACETLWARYRLHCSFLPNQCVCKLLMMRGETSLFIFGQRILCHGQLCPPPLQEEPALCVV